LAVCLDGKSGACPEKKYPVRGRRSVIRQRHRDSALHNAVRPPHDAATKQALVAQRYRWNEWFGAGGGEAARRYVP